MAPPTKSKGWLLYWLTLFFFRKPLGSPQLRFAPILATSVCPPTRAPAPACISSEAVAAPGPLHALVPARCRVRSKPGRVCGAEPVGQCGAGKGPQGRFSPAGGVEPSTRRGGNENAAATSRFVACDAGERAARKPLGNGAKSYRDRSRPLRPDEVRTGRWLSRLDVSVTGKRVGMNPRFGVLVAVQAPCAEQRRDFLRRSWRCSLPHRPLVPAKLLGRYSNTRNASRPAGKAGSQAWCAWMTYY